MKIYGNQITKGQSIRIPSASVNGRVITVGLVGPFGLVDVPGRQDIEVVAVGPHLNHYLLDSVELYELA